MTPRTGRPMSQNPKNERVTVRLTEYQQALVHECAEKFGTTKADIFCRGLALMGIEKDNEEARQLFDAIVLLHQMKSGKEKQIAQVEQNFRWYIESIKK